MGEGPTEPAEKTKKKISTTRWAATCVVFQVFSCGDVIGPSARGDSHAHRTGCIEKSKQGRPRIFFFTVIFSREGLDISSVGRPRSTAAVSHIPAALCVPRSSPNLDMSVIPHPSSTAVVGHVGDTSCADIISQPRHLVWNMEGAVTD